MNILGVDGSLRNFGFAVFKYDSASSTLDGLVTLKLSQTEASKDKKLNKSTDDFNRFGWQFNYLTSVIHDYDIKTAIVEIPAGARDARAAFAFGGTTALYSTLPVLGVNVITVLPKLVKKKSIGIAHADKEDIINWAYNLYPEADWLKSKRKNAMNIRDSSGLYLKNENEHLADAIAIVHAGLDQIK